MLVFGRTALGHALRPLSKNTHFFERPETFVRMIDVTGAWQRNIQPRSPKFTGGEGRDAPIR